VSFEIVVSVEASNQLNEQQSAKDKIIVYKAVVKALRILSENPRHPDLNTHEYSALSGPDGVKVFEAYAQNNTPGAYRIFFCYHPPKAARVTIIAITPHP
jgi:hypothetical protein